MRHTTLADRLEFHPRAEPDDDNRFMDIFWTVVIALVAAMTVAAVRCAAG